MTATDQPKAPETPPAKAPPIPADERALLEAGWVQDEKTLRWRYPPELINRPYGRNELGQVCFASESRLYRKEEAKDMQKQYERYQEVLAKEEEHRMEEAKKAQRKSGLPQARYGHRL